MQNIDEFNLYTVAALTKLYAKFPKPMKLSCFKIWKDTLRLDGEPHDTVDAQQSRNEQRVINATLDWLKKNDYFTAQDQSKYVYKTAVLTPKGLEALSATPKALEGGVTVGERMAEALKETGKETRGALIAELVGYVSGAALKGIIAGSS